MIRAYLIYIVLLLIPLKGWAQNDVVVISSTKELQQLGKFVYFLEDETGNLTVEAILLPENQAKFQQNEAEIFVRPASASVFWFKMTIQNETEANLWLNFGDSFATWEADFYAPDTQGNYTQKIELGVPRPQEYKFFPSTYYCVPLNLKKTTSQTFYLRLSGSFPKTHDFLVGSTKKMNEHLKFLNSVVMLFVGFILSILGYNLFIWFSTREKVYLIYIFYLGLIIIIVPFDNGDTLFYWKPLWTHHFLYHNLLFILMRIFAIVYLEMYQKARKLTYWILFLLVLFGMLPIIRALNVVPFVALINPFQLILLIFYFTLLGSGIYLWRKGEKKARFYVLAWIFLIGSAFAFIFSINGLLSYNSFTSSALYLGVALESLFFALALGDRLNILKKEKEEVHAKNIQLVQNQNETLNQKVQEKTQELQETNEELQQTQEELSAQRDLLEWNNRELQSYQTRMTQSIQSAQTIQNAILPTSNKIQRYFSDHFILYLPKDVVSGDFYWMTKHQEKVIFIEADCTGHGVSGAFTTLIGNAIFDRVIQIQNITEPSQILDHTHQLFQEILQQNETHNPQGMDLSIVVISESDNDFSIQFGSAGQRLYYSENQTLKAINGSRKKVGGYLKSKSQKIFETHEIRLHQDAILYLCSDGFIDQHNVHRQRSGSERFFTLLEKVQTKSLAEQKITLQNSLQAHQRDQEQRDDITIIGLKL